jgi:hypothetical protein
MTEVAIFNRRYTSFDSSGTTVFLVNGGGVTTDAQSTLDFTAGEALNQGDFVYISGVSVFKASALSGIAPTNYEVIGVTAESAPLGSGVSVNVDDVAVMLDANITADVALITGEKYYLSKYTGQITRFSTASGVVSNSGDNQYQVLAPVGTALSTSELKVEIQPTVILYS